MPHETNRTRRRNNPTQTTPTNNQTTRTTPSMETITNAITTLQTITWPADQDLATYNPNKASTHRRTMPGSTDFGLSHTTLTRAHAQTIIHTVRATIQHTINPNSRRPTPAPNYLADLAYIKHTLTQGHIKPTLAPAYRALVRLAYRAEQTCGYGTETTEQTCPQCGHRLHQTQTSEGLTPTHHCPHCHTVYTTQTHKHTTITTILTNAHNLTVTQTQAAQLLGLPLKTIHKRTRDRHLTPTNHTHPHTYKLNELL